MYIPILLAGIFLGKKYGVITALFAGVLLGPLMPIDTISGEMQIPINYLYRLGIFMLVGFFSGFASDLLRKQIKSILKAVSLNQETQVPNTNHLMNLDFTKDYYPGALLITVIINNSNTIIDVLGLKKLHLIIYEVYHNLLHVFNEPCHIVQSGVDKLWIMKPFSDIEEDMKILDLALHEQIIIDNVSFYVEYSVGCAYSGEIEKISSLEPFSHSDISAREAFNENRKYIFYDESYFKKLKNFELLGSFKDAIMNEELFLVYQPKMDIITNKPYGIEALIRWQHPTKGTIFPDSFIPLVEETKLIHSLTNFVIHKSLEQIKKFDEQGIDTTISINVSGKDLYYPDFAQNVIDLVKSSNINPERFEIEITETSLMTNAEASKAVLQKLFKTGIKISLDDYGTGYSSLAYLSTFPIHVLKIDRAFIAQMSENPNVIQIVKSTINLAHELGYQVVAEGIETAEDESILKTLGCDKGQGYYYAKPMTEELTLKWMKEHL